MNVLRPKILTIAVGAVGLVVGSFFIVRAFLLMRATQALMRETSVQRSPASFEEDHKPSARAEDILVTLDEMVANLVGRDASESHILAMKLELEIFDEPGKALLEQRLAGVKNAVLDAARSQEFERMKTLPGKLYLKELMVAKMNGYLRKPVIRDIHFSSFYLR